MGLSRKSYYQWEQRALAALLEAVQPQPAGHPSLTPDPEKEALRQRVAHLEQQVAELEQVNQLRQIVQQIMASGTSTKKNSRS
jgi:hypothetical protein